MDNFQLILRCLLVSRSSWVSGKRGTDLQERADDVKRRRHGNYVADAAAHHC